MKLSDDQIKEINLKAPYNQGVFIQPYGIPVSVKEPVIYMRYETGGCSGGNCWGDKATYYHSSDKIPEFEVLDAVLKVLYPNISYLNFRKILTLIHDNNETEYEYYGNSTDWYIQYIKLSELYNLLESFVDK